MPNNLRPYKGLQLLNAANSTGSYKTWVYGYLAKGVVNGTFDGASVTLQIKLDSANISDVPVYLPNNSDLFNATATRSYDVSIPPGADVRAVVTGAGANTSISCHLIAASES